MSGPRDKWSSARSAADAYMRDPVIAVALGLIAIAWMLRMWALSTGYFYSDDFLLLDDAATHRFDLAYLLMPENSHLMPATRAMYALVAGIDGLSWAAAVAISGVLQLVVLLSCLWALVTLFGRRWAVLPLLCLYLSSAISAQATLWWVSSLNQSGVLIGVFASIACWVKYLRTGHLRWAASTAASIVLGLLFFHKVLLVVPVLIFIMFAYFATGGFLERARHVLSSYWRSAVLVGVPLALWLTLVGARVSSGGFQLRLSSSLALAESMVLRAFPAGITGGPYQWGSRRGGAWADPSLVYLTASWIVIAAVIALSLIYRRRAGRAWVLLLGYYVILVAVVAGARVTVFGTEIGMAYRLQTDGLAIAVIALGLAFLHIPGACESSAQRRDSHQMLPRLCLVATVLVSLGGTANWVWYSRDWAANDARGYISTLENDTATAGERVDVADVVLPASVVDPISAPRNRLSAIAAGADLRVDFPTTSGNLAMVGESGHLRTPELLPQVASEPGTTPKCGWLVSRKGVRIPMRSDETELGRWMRISYFAGQAGTVQAKFAGQSRPIEIRRGLHYSWIRLNDDTFDSVVLVPREPTTSMCVDKLVVGAILPGNRIYP